MKKSNIFLAVTLVIIIGVILSSCDPFSNARGFTPHCPYCKSTSLKKIETSKVDYKEVFEMQCKKCDKFFWLTNWE